MLVDLTEQHFGKLQRTNGGVQILNTETPKFTPGLLYVRDDQMQQQNVGVFYNAPCWRDPDFFAFLLLQRIMGNFTMDHYLESMADLEAQPNMMHEFLKVIPDLQRFDAVYSPYTDCGIFGFYFQGDPNYTQTMSYLGGKIGEVLSEYLTDQDVTRAKYRLYNELMAVQSASDIMQ